MNRERIHHYLLFLRPKFTYLHIKLTLKKTLSFQIIVTEKFVLEIILIN